MRKKIGTFEAAQETMDQIGGGGALLVSGDSGNPMTIGWGTIGIIWSRPLFVVLVRPSRFTFGLMEECGEFSVNVPDESLADQVEICGSKSGRDVDKIRECGFTLGKSGSISVPFLKECPIHYECRIVHKNDVSNANLADEIVRTHYGAGDFHRVYYGEILGVFRETG